MTLDDPRSYERYEEDPRVAETRLMSRMNIERLQDEMRRVKKSISFEAMARLIPTTLAEWAPSYPSGGELIAQNIYDFLKLKSPSTPSPPRRLAFHAFMMVVDKTYREKWNHDYFVRDAGLTLCKFFGSNIASNSYEHNLNLQKASGFFTYMEPDEIAAPSWKPGYEFRCLLLKAPKDLPFLLACDFDYASGQKAVDGITEEDALQFGTYLSESQDLDARIGFYIPKRSAEEGILLLNSFKWDWPTIYGSIFSYVTNEFADGEDGQVIDLILADVNSRQIIDRTEPSYHAADYEVPDDRKVVVKRSALKPESFGPLASVFETRFSWGIDL